MYAISPARNHATTSTKELFTNNNWIYVNAIRFVFLHAKNNIIEGSPDTPYMDDKVAITGC